MALNNAEKNFIESVQKKIDEYNIPVKIEECVKRVSGNFGFTYFHGDKKNKELVDIEVEKFLISKSFNYFIKKYLLKLFTSTYTIYFTK